MDVIEVITLGCGLDALCFLAAVVVFDAKCRVDDGFDDAGLGLPGVGVDALHAFATASFLPGFVAHIAPMARVAAGLAVVFGGGGVEVAELFEDGRNEHTS